MAPEVPLQGQTGQKSRSTKPNSLSDLCEFFARLAVKTFFNRYLRDGARKAPQVQREI